MTFSYNTYRDIALVIPAIVIIFMLILLVLSSLKFWRDIMKKEELLNSVIKYSFSVVIILWCIIPQAKTLLNGGVYLIKENEFDAVTYSGIIEHISEPSERIPTFKSSHNYGADVLIDGTEYFAISARGFDIGDKVTILYLPNSKFIISVMLL